MNKGQIFSIDFVIAMILMIFFLGLLLNLGELQSYERKERRITYELESKTEAALITLTNSPNYSCKLDTNSFLAYSFDRNKIKNINHNDLKNSIGLNDYNLSLLFNPTNPNHIDEHNGLNIYSIDINVLFCDGDISYQDINNCHFGACSGSIEKQVLSVRVSK